MTNAVMLDVVVAGMSCLLAFACVPWARRLSLKYGVTVKPGPGHPHARITAKLGGLAILAGFMVPLLATGSMPWWLGLCASAMTFFGLADDIWTLAPRTKLGAQLLIVGFFAFPARPLGFALWPWAVAIATTVWLIATTNAFNVID